MAKQKIVESKSVEITTVPGGRVQTTALFDLNSFAPGANSVNDNNSTFFIDVTGLVFSNVHTSLSGGFKCLQHFVYRNGNASSRAMINTSTFDRPTCWYYPDDFGCGESAIYFTFALRDSSTTIKQIPAPKVLYPGYDQVVAFIDQTREFNAPVRILLSWDVIFYKDV